MTTKKSSGPATGLGVDKYGGGVVDPTANVIALTEAANNRQDDLRIETNRRLDSEIGHIKFLAALRAEHNDKVSEMRETHTKEMRAAESARIDAIRQVDVLARERDTTAATLAIQSQERGTATLAETLRKTVSESRDELARSTAQVTATLAGRITELEQTRYREAGKGEGSKDTSASIRAAIGLGILILGFALANLLPLLRK